MKSAPLNEYRCKCGRLLFKGALLTCKLEIKCKRCGGIKTIIYNNGNSILREHYENVFSQGFFNRNEKKSKTSFTKKRNNNGFWFFLVSLFFK